MAGSPTGARAKAPAAAVNAAAPGAPGAADAVDAVRRFNRFYTQRIGALNEGLARSPFSLTECRVLYELAHRDRPAAADLCADLELDAGYLSRIVSGFRRRGLVEQQPSGSDRRQRLLTLTRRGHQAFTPLERRTRAEIGGLLQGLSRAERARLVEAMAVIERLLDAKSEPNVPFLLRPPHPGDMGWVVKRHGELYAEEYGYDEEFEALVAEIVADFTRRFDAALDRCWMAERGGRNVGCVFVVRKSRSVAKLRLLLVDPEARGLGIGSRLVAECIAFARRAGYRTLTLWTQNDLHAARRIYRNAGFVVVSKKPHHSFGQDLVAETWELKL
jgi:DNA-binding MarR family transcriptional regulator/GNAT superfamily N-acetyltransferase